MTILNDRQIATLAKNGMIEPFEPSKVSDGVISYGLSSAGYDVRLADRFYQYFPKNDPRSYNNDGEIVIDPKVAGKRPEKYGYFFDCHTEKMMLPARGFLLGRTVEKFNIPSDIIAKAVSKSTYVRVAVFSPITPLEPDWRGYLTLEIVNMLDRPVYIYPNEGIAQVMFYRLESNPMKGYGVSGKYQDQKKDVVLPYVRS